MSWHSGLLSFSLAGRDRQPLRTLNLRPSHGNLTQNPTSTCCLLFDHCKITLNDYLRRPYNTVYFYPSEDHISELLQPTWYAPSLFPLLQTPRLVVPLQTRRKDKQHTDYCYYTGRLTHRRASFGVQGSVLSICEYSPPRYLLYEADRTWPSGQRWRW